MINTVYCPKEWSVWLTVDINIVSSKETLNVNISALVDWLRRYEWKEHKKSQTKQEEIERHAG